MKVLFIVPYPTEGASNRLRVEQFLRYLDQREVQWRVEPFMSRELYSILYVKGHRLRKVYYFVKAFFRYLWVLLAASKYDVVFIHRRIFPIWTPFNTWLLRRLPSGIIFDFDDGIFLSNKSDLRERIYTFFKQSHRVRDIIKLSSRVIAGNEFLKDYALKYNPNVVIIPTPVETEVYRAESPKDGRDGRVIMGWIGSHTTAKYLKMLDRVFEKLLARYPQLEVRVIGGQYTPPSRNGRIKNLPWSLERELEDLRTFDIGIMPLRDDEWERYKCGFKALLYMSVKLPVVCSPVGVNNYIVEDGVNGFLARSEEEWIEKVSHLVESPELRERMGREGQARVEAHYSVKGNFHLFQQVISDAYEDGLEKRRAEFERSQKKTQRSFDFQWTEFPDMVPANEEHFLNYIHPVGPGFFNGKVGLDAACGFGRHLYYAAQYGARRVVGMDFSNAIFTARATNRDFANVSLAKGDIYSLPFKPGSFDFIYCLGAIHHLPDPERGFRALLSCLKPGAPVFIWVYSTKRVFINFVTESARRITHRIPHRALKRICFVFALLDYMLFIKPYKMLRKFPLIERIALSRIKLYAKFPFSVCYADWFDRFSAPIRHYFGEEELREWAYRAGLKKVIITPTEKYGWRLYGEKEERSPSWEKECATEEEAAVRRLGPAISSPAQGASSALSP